jgi:pSer/pThr/pTyr-binding forkhead associated (FHA) protein
VVQLLDGEVVRHVLVEREITIGRDPENVVCIPHAFVSSFHAKLVRYGDAFTLVDLGSVNKTRVNGRPVLQKSLTPGDEIEFAGVKASLVPAVSPEIEKTGKSMEEVSSPADDIESPSSRSESNFHEPASRLPLLAVVLLLILIAVYLATQFL